MVLDGKSLKLKILNEIKNEVSKLTVKPKLVVIQVGNDEASNVYIKQKCDMCNYVGYMYEHIKLDSSVTVASILELIDKLNNDNDVTGILVQLPLPKKLNEGIIINSISPEKDVDGLTDINAGMLLHNKDCLYSCTPYGIIELLDNYNISVSGKNVVIVGRSVMVGKPMGIMMLNRDASVTMCHSKTRNLIQFTKNADILIAAIGSPKFITGDMVKEGVVVIDVGINRLSDGLCGDVDFDSVCDKASYITPVPGGVGPMTIAMLSKNILKVYSKKRTVN